MRATAILVLFAVTRVAVADVREDARTEFAAGQEADRAKDYVTAIQHYTRANELVPHPFALYNIAADNERLGLFREAARVYQLYLDKAPPGPDRDKVVRQLAALQTKPTSLSVRSSPAGARVRVDGNVVGASPINVTLPGGPHHVAIDRGSDHQEQDINLEYGEPGDVNFNLSGTAPGRLYVFGTPVGAFVAVDNITVGALPSNFEVAAGPHTVRVSAPGYTPYETGVTVDAGQSAKLDARLPRDLASLDTTTADGKPHAIKLHYEVGFVGGAELSKGDPLGLVEIGIGGSQYDGALRIGHASGGTQVDLLFRWVTLPTVVSPFIGGGISGGGLGSGYFAVAGLRVDLFRENRVGFAILADVGIRGYTQTDTSTDANSSGAVYPLELSAEVKFR